jgi:hypothetical protein
MEMPLAASPSISRGAAQHSQAAAKPEIDSRKKL